MIMYSAPPAYRGGKVSGLSDKPIIEIAFICDTRASNRFLLAFKILI